MRTYKLDKTVVRVRDNAAKFLNGLTSNTLESPRNAFLNLNGRIIATFDQACTGGDEVLLVISPSAWEPLKSHTDRYARLNHTTIETTPLNVYFDLDGDVPLAQGDHTIPQNAGRMIVTSRTLLPTISIGEFTLFRLEYQIPMHGVDYTDEMVLNVHEHDFVSYTKGCFLGQEPVAKVHNRAKPTWKLAVRYADELSVEERAKMTSQAIEPQTGRTRGFVFTRNI